MGFCQFYGEDEFLNAWGIDDTGQLWVHADFLGEATARYEHKTGNLTVKAAPSPKGKLLLASDVFPQSTVDEIKAHLMTTGN